MLRSLFALFAAFALSSVQLKATWADESAAPGAAGPIIESIDGASSLQIHGADGTVRTEDAGGELREGDWWDQPQEAVCRLLFAQGSQMLITGGTRVEVRDEPAEQGGTIPVVLLGRGEVRTLVEPAHVPSEQVQAKKPLRFIIRTKTAVMGVRGTDFVVQASGDQSSVHTMEGTVDVGRDTAAVKSGAAVAVPANQFVDSHASEIEPPRHFDAPGFLQQFHQRHPRMKGLWRRAIADQRSGRVHKLYRQRRQQRRIRRERPPRRVQRRGAAVGAGARGKARAKEENSGAKRRTRRWRR